MFDMAQIEQRLRGGAGLNHLTLPEEQLLLGYARARGLSAKELARRWAAAGPVTATGFHARPARVGTELQLHDLDFWPVARVPLRSFGS